MFSDILAYKNLPGELSIDREFGMAKPKYKRRKGPLERDVSYNFV